jgi:dienelactone hydrolase
VNATAAARREALWRLLGPRPWRDGGVDGVRIDRRDGLERWRLQLNREQDVPALLLRPVDRAPRGVMLYCHAHGGRFELGGDELLQGRAALQRPYGPELAARGWAALAIDHAGFGERREPSERALVKRTLWAGETLWGWRVHDTLAALDWLQASQPDLAALPVVTLGLSMGSTMAIWAAALDDRIDGCIDLCCAAEYDALLASGGFEGHGEYFFVPRLLSEGFTLAEICALIAPRPHLSLAGRGDPLTPPAGLTSLDAALRQAYAACGAASAWRQIVEDGGHAETATMRAAVLTWLERFTPGGEPP